MIATFAATLINADTEWVWNDNSGVTNTSSGGGAIGSANSQTGVVVLDAGDVGAATETYVDAAIAALIESSPGALNTLNELAAATRTTAGERGEQTLKRAE